VTDGLVQVLQKGRRWDCLGHAGSIEWTWRAVAARGGETCLWANVAGIRGAAYP